jgi:hypothetical protein
MRRRLGILAAFLFLLWPGRGLAAPTAPIAFSWQGHVYVLAASGTLVPTGDSLARDPAWSADGRVLAALGPEGGAGASVGWWRSTGSSGVLLIDGVPPFVTAFAWAPTGERLALAVGGWEGRAPASAGIWVTTLTGEARRLSSLTGVRSLAWLPDGTGVVASTSHSLVRVDLDGRVRTLFASPDQLNAVGFVPGSETYLFSVKAPTRSPIEALAAVELPSGRLVRLPAGGAEEVAAGPGRGRVTLVAPGGTLVTCAVAGGCTALPLGDGIEAAAWSAGGGELAFVRAGRLFVYHDGRLVTLATVGGEVKDLTWDEGSLLYVTSAGIHRLAPVPGAKPVLLAGAGAGAGGLALPP